MIESEVQLVCRGTQELERSIASDLAKVDPDDAYAAIVSYVLVEGQVEDVTIT